MVERLSRTSYTWWVKVARWGASGRSAQWAWFAASVALAVSCVVIGLLVGNGWFAASVAFLLAALWYWLSIQWVDRHGSWSGGAQ